MTIFLMKSYCLTWGERVSVMSQPCFSGCQHNTVCPHRAVPFCPGNASVVVSGVCQAFYVHMGLVIRPKSRSLKLNPRRMSWRNLCFPSLWSSSFLELSLCTQTGWVPQGSSEVPSMPWGASQDRAAGWPVLLGCAELLTDPDFFEEC